MKTAKQIMKYAFCGHKVTESDLKNPLIYNQITGQLRRVWCPACRNRKIERQAARDAAAERAETSNEINGL